MKLFCAHVFVLAGIVGLGQGQVVGKPCVDRIEKIKGVCKSTNDCPSSLERADRGIHPTICGFQQPGNYAIVCCLDSDSISGRPSLPEVPRVDPMQSPGQSQYPVQSQNQNPVQSQYPVQSPNQSPVQSPNQSPVQRPVNSQTPPRGASPLPLEIQPSRKSLKKCEEFHVRKTTFLNLLRDPQLVTKNTSRCDLSGLHLIVGGTNAKLGEFPFMAALGYNDDKIHCGGSLISENFILTAAHCIETKNFGYPTFVILGDLDLASSSDLADPIKVNVDSVISHAEYNSKTKQHDIGLLKLVRAVDFNRAVRPACLWTDNTVEEDQAIAAGWGITETGRKSDILKKVSLKLRENNECSYSSVSITDGMICAGTGGGNDTCSGDSGGPLLLTKDSCLFQVLGITSFGPQDCGNYPAVYTKVSRYISWIEERVWPDA